MSFLRRQESTDVQNVNTSVIMDPCLRKGDKSVSLSKILDSRLRGNDSLPVLPVLRKITNSYTIKLPAKAGPISARGESETLSMQPKLPEITNSYTIKLDLAELCG